MRAWQVWRQDTNGNRFLVGTYDDRVAALARVLILESRLAHKQTHWVAGAAEPACVTNRDLYRRILRLGDDMTADGRSLSAYLRALWLVSGSIRDRDPLELDTVAALLAAAATADPPPFDPVWRTADLAVASDEPAGYPWWERIILSQIADLEDFVAQPPGQYASFGVDAPRPPGSGRRATPVRWYNFDPASYLECAMAGSLGGWQEQDNVRVSLPGPVTPGGAQGSEIVEFQGLTWAELGRFAVCGQIYE